MAASGDPADAMFTTANFPGASSTDLTAAKTLYAILTGRVSSIGRNARIAEDGTTYNILGESMQKGRLKQTGFHMQDSWRIKPNFTVNAGLRYELQLPFYALNNSYSMRRHRRPVRHERHRLELRPGVHRQRHREHVHAGREGRGADDVRAVLGGHRGLQHGQEQPRAERRRGVDDRLGEGLPPHAARQAG